jgi:hypothetical protein
MGKGSRGGNRKSEVRDMQVLATRQDAGSDAGAAAGAVPASAAVAVPSPAGLVQAVRAGDGQGGRGAAALAGGVRKYRNRKTVIDGITFDSNAEAGRWRELTLLQRAGHITDLQRQVVYVLAPSVKFAGAKRAQPALRLILDFGYRQAGHLVLEDVKGVITTAFTIKRHLLKALHGQEVRLIR